MEEQRRGTVEDEQLGARENERSGLIGGPIRLSCPGLRQDCQLAWSPHQGM